MKKYINAAINYDSYCGYVENQAENSTDKYAEYFPINYQRMERLNKNLSIPDSLKAKINQLTPLYYLILSEGWCGDCAQIVPILAKMEKASKNIELKILIAEENLELLDKYLINNSRSVPLVLGINKENFKVEFKWGARPLFGLELLKKYKSDENYSKDMFQKDLQIAYNKDKGIKTINELIALHYEIK